MKKTLSRSLGRSLVSIAVTIAVAALSGACADGAPLAPDQQPAMAAQFAQLRPAHSDRAIATLRQATARYHSLNAAIEDGFVFLHGCENRPGEGPVGTVYVHPGRLMDGIIDPASPEGLIYDTNNSRNERPKLIGVELAVPYPLWTEAEPPRFLDVSFGREDEFGVFGLHVWVWGRNPDGMFAESNPKVTCDEA